MAVTNPSDKLIMFELRKENNALLNVYNAQQDELKALSGAVAEDKRALVAQAEQIAEEKVRLRDLQERLARQAIKIQELQKQCLSEEQLKSVVELITAYKTNKDRFHGLVVSEEDSNEDIFDRDSTHGHLTSLSKAPRQQSLPRKDSFDLPIIATGEGLLGSEENEIRPDFSTGDGGMIHRPEPETRPHSTPATYPKSVVIDVTDNHKNMNEAGAAQPPIPVEEQPNRQEDASSSSRAATKKRPAARTSKPPPKKARTAHFGEPHRPQTRSNYTNGTVDTPAPKPAQRKQARLPRQRTKPMAVFYNQFNEIYHKDFHGHFTDMEKEYDFVNQFLAGVQEQEVRDSVTLILQQMYRSTIVKKKIRVECRWDQVWAGLVHAELVDGTARN